MLLEYQIMIFVVSIGALRSVPPLIGSAVRVVV